MGAGKKSIMDRGGFHAPHNKPVRPVDKLEESFPANSKYVDSPQGRTWLDQARAPGRRHKSAAQQAETIAFLSAPRQAFFESDLLDPEFDEVESLSDFVNAEFRLQIEEAA